jgi:hypothetical protein
LGPADIRSVNDQPQSLERREARPRVRPAIALQEQLPVTAPIRAQPSYPASRQLATKNHLCDLSPDSVPIDRRYVDVSGLIVTEAIERERTFLLAFFSNFEIDPMWVLPHF